MNESRYSYDRQADTGPASRLKNVEPPIKAAEREIEKSKGILHGLVRELEMVAKHTHDPTVQNNFKHIQDFSERLEDIDSNMDRLIADIEKFLKGFR